jgi:methylase of polypeptide subunit release factors
MSDESRKRRSLTHIGGATDTVGDPDAARALAWALEVAPASDADDDPARSHVHGFHTYPARMHPVTAARLVQAFTPAGGKVLDPFCGSGTVLVEAMILGRRPLGVDLNPLAVRLAGCKTHPRQVADLEQLVVRAKACAARADERRKAKAGATRRFPSEDVALFEPHVLLELDSLRSAIGVGNDPVDLDLSLVLSAVLGKLSRQRGDTSGAIEPRRTAGGYAARLFVRKAEDLAQRLAALGTLLPAPPPRAFVAQDDAVLLRTLPPGKVDAIVTSPPYAATYDYVGHHALRLRWLGLDAAPLIRGEIGARSVYRRIAPREAPATWSRELARFFEAAAHVLPRGGPLVLLTGDSAVGDTALRADEITAATARSCGFVPAARASQPRPHFHGPTMAAFRAQPRAEHAILLRRE